MSESKWYTDGECDPSEGSGVSEENDGVGLNM